MMNFTLHWDNEQQSCVRCDIRGFIKQVNWLEPINDMAGMALMSDAEKVSSMIVIPFGCFPFPNHPFSVMKTTILASQSYGLGKVAIVASNPFVRWLLQIRLMDDDIANSVFIVSNIAKARQLLQSA